MPLRIILNSEIDTKNQIPTLNRFFTKYLFWLNNKSSSTQKTSSCCRRTFRCLQEVLECYLDTSKLTKMVRMKLWKVILCMTIEFVIVFSGPKLLQKEYYCVNELLNTLTAISNVSIHRSSHNLYQKYNDLKCGFIYSAHFHMYWTRNIYKEKDQEIIKQFPNNEISLVYESIDIINLLFYKKGIQMNELWLFYIYAQKTSEFYKTIVEKNIKDQDRLTKYIEMHDFIFAELENYLKINCDDDFYFDPNCEYCEYYKNIIKVPGDNEVNLYRCTQNAIRVNKIMLKKLHYEWIKTDGFDYNQAFIWKIELYFDAFYTQYLSENFWGKYLKKTKWHSVFSKIGDKKQSSIEFGLHGITDTGLYQQMVIEIMKIVTLQKMSLCFIYLFKLKNKNYFLRTLNHFVAIFKQFINYMGLADDYFFTFIQNSLNLAFLKKPENWQIIIEKINYEIDMISKTWNYPPDYGVPNNVLQKENILNSVEKDILKSTTYFFEDCKKYKSSRALGFIHSFIKMSNNLNIKMNSLVNIQTRVSYTVELKFYNV